MSKPLRIVMAILAAVVADVSVAGENRPIDSFAPLPAQVRDLASRAGRAFASGNLEAARGLYGKALKISPDSATLLVSAAAVETRLGNIASSRDLLQKAVSLEVNNGPAWLLLGMNDLDSDKDEEAFADLARAVLLDPTNPRSHHYLGMAAGRKGWTEAAETELRRAVELDPGYADANFNLAVLYLGRTPPLTEMAKRHYQRALELGTKPDPAVDKLLFPTVATPSSPTITTTPQPSMP